MCEDVPKIDLLTCVVLNELDGDLHGEYVYKNLFFNNIYPEDILMDWFYSIPFYKDLRETVCPNDIKFKEI
jgi:hypothetical protein